MVDKRNSFSLLSRLPDAASYSRVFKRPNRSINENFTILWRTNRLDRGRLGLAVAKKNIKRAVDRNLVKRIIRESYRHQQHCLAGIDAVVLVRRDLSVRDKKRLRSSIDGLWQQVSRKIKQESANSC